MDGRSREVWREWHEGNRVREMEGKKRKCMVRKKEGLCDTYH